MYILVVNFMEVYELFNFVLDPENLYLLKNIDQELFNAVPDDL